MNAAMQYRQPDSPQSGVPSATHPPLPGGTTTYTHLDRKMTPGRLLVALLLVANLTLPGLLSAQDTASPIAGPDGKPADLSKPVQVFILLGQSNMVGLGKVKGGENSLEHAVREKRKYPYLIDESGGWTVRQDVRYVQYMSGRGPLRNEWLTVAGGNIGPEYGIGHLLGNAIDAPVLVLKC